MKRWFGLIAVASAAVVGLVLVSSGGGTGDAEQQEVAEAIEAEESTAQTTVATTTSEREETTTTAPSTSAAPASSDENPSEDDTAEAQGPIFLTDIEVGQLGDTFLRFRFQPSEATSYTAVVKKDGEVISTSEGSVDANVVERGRIDGLEPGTVYNAQIILTGPPSVQSYDLLFQTTGSEPDPTLDTQAEPVEIRNLTLTSVQFDRIQFDYTSNVCANGTFIIIEQATGEQVGENLGSPEGCIDKHLGIPGQWTPSLSPETTYVVLVSLEANGFERGRPYGNVVTESLVVTTPPRPVPADPAERAVGAVSLVGLEQQETDQSSVRIDFGTNVCANVSFVVREVGGTEVGRHPGFPRGCATSHSAVPGVWTPELSPDTSYVVVITAEADGLGQGDGNVVSESITVRTAPLVEADEAAPLIEITSAEIVADGDSATVVVSTSTCSELVVSSFESGGAGLGVTPSVGDCSLSHEIDGIALSEVGATLVVVSATGEADVTGAANRSSTVLTIE